MSHLASVEFSLTPCGYSDIGLKHWFLAESGKFDPAGAALADRHYSRRTPGSPQFMPPGQTIVLIGKDMRSVFGWHRPHPDAGIVPMNKLYGWTCTIFRNEGECLSSQLILDAELAVGILGFDCGPDGLITYVWDSKVESANPGYCFKLAGWKTDHQKRSADGKKTCLRKPWKMRGQ